MFDRGLSALARSALIVPVVFLLIACGGGDAGLSDAEVEKIVRAELANTPAPPEPELTSADVSGAIRAAMAEMPQQEPGLAR